MGLHSSTLDYCFNLVLTLAYPMIRVLSAGARAYARLWRLLIRAKQCAINPLSLRRLGGANVLLGAGFCGVICICVALWMARTLCVQCTARCCRQISLHSAVTSKERFIRNGPWTMTLMKCVKPAYILSTVVCKHWRPRILGGCLSFVNVSLKRRSVVSPNQDVGGFSCFLVSDVIRNFVFDVDCLIEPNGRAWSRARAQMKSFSML